MPEGVEQYDYSNPLMWLDYPAGLARGLIAGKPFGETARGAEVSGADPDSREEFLTEMLLDPSELIMGPAMKVASAALPLLGIARGQRVAAKQLAKHVGDLPEYATSTERAMAQHRLRAIASGEQPVDFVMSSDKLYDNELLKIADEITDETADAIEMALQGDIPVSRMGEIGETGNLGEAGRRESLVQGIQEGLVSAQESGLRRELREQLDPNISEEALEQAVSQRMREHYTAPEGMGYDQPVLQAGQIPSPEDLQRIIEHRRRMMNVQQAQEVAPQGAEGFPPFPQMHVVTNPFRIPKNVPDFVEEAAQNTGISVRTEGITVEDEAAWRARAITSGVSDVDPKITFEIGGQGRTKRNARIQEWKNVRDSDVTLFFGSTNSKEFEAAAESAQMERKTLFINPTPSEFADWSSRNRPGVVNVTKTEDYGFAPDRGNAVKLTYKVPLRDGLKDTLRKNHEWSSALAEDGLITSAIYGSKTQVGAVGDVIYFKDGRGLRPQQYRITRVRKLHQGDFINDGLTPKPDLVKDLSATGGWSPQSLAGLNELKPNSKVYYFEKLEKPLPHTVKGKVDEFMNPMVSPATETISEVLAAGKKAVSEPGVAGAIPEGRAAWEMNPLRPWEPLFPTGEAQSRANFADIAHRTDLPPFGQTDTTMSSTLPQGRGLKYDDTPHSRIVQMADGSYQQTNVNSLSPNVVEESEDISRDLYRPLPTDIGGGELSEFGERVMAQPGELIHDLPRQDHRRMKPAKDTEKIYSLTENGPRDIRHLERTAEGVKRLDPDGRQEFMGLIVDEEQKVDRLKRIPDRESLAYKEAASEAYEAGQAKQRLIAKFGVDEEIELIHIKLASGAELTQNERRLVAAEAGNYERERAIARNLRQGVENASLDELITFREKLMYEGTRPKERGNIVERFKAHDPVAKAYFNLQHELYQRTTKRIEQLGGTPALADNWELPFQSKVGAPNTRDTGLELHRTMKGIGNKAKKNPHTYVLDLNAQEKRALSVYMGLPENALQDASIQSAARLISGDTTLRRELPPFVNALPGDSYKHVVYASSMRDRTKAAQRIIVNMNKAAKPSGNLVMLEGLKDHLLWLDENALKETAELAAHAGQDPEVMQLITRQLGQLDETGAAQHSFGKNNELAELGFSVKEKDGVKTMYVQKASSPWREDKAFVLSHNTDSLLAHAILQEAKLKGADEIILALDHTVDSRGSDGVLDALRGITETKGETKGTLPTVIDPSPRTGIELVDRALEARGRGAEEAARITRRAAMSGGEDAVALAGIVSRSTGRKLDDVAAALSHQPKAKQIVPDVVPRDPLAPAVAAEPDFDSLMRTIGFGHAPGTSPLEHQRSLGSPLPSPGGDPLGKITPIRTRQGGLALGRQAPARATIEERIAKGDMSGIWHGEDAFNKAARQVESPPPALRLGPESLHWDDILNADVPDQADELRKQLRGFSDEEGRPVPGHIEKLKEHIESGGAVVISDVLERAIAGQEDAVRRVWHEEFVKPLEEIAGSTTAVKRTPGDAPQFKRLRYSMPSSEDLAHDMGITLEELERSGFSEMLERAEGAPTLSQIRARKKHLEDIVSEIRGAWISHRDYKGAPSTSYDLARTKAVPHRRARGDAPPQQTQKPEVQKFSEILDKLDVSPDRIKRILLDHGELGAVTMDFVEEDIQRQWASLVKEFKGRRRGRAWNKKVKHLEKHAEDWVNRYEKAIDEILFESAPMKVLPEFTPDTVEQVAGLSKGAQNRILKRLSPEGRESLETLLTQAERRVAGSEGIPDFELETRQLLAKQGKDPGKPMFGLIPTQAEFRESMLPMSPEDMWRLNKIEAPLPQREPVDSEKLASIFRKREELQAGQPPHLQQMRSQPSPKPKRKRPQAKDRKLWEKDGNDEYYSTPVERWDAIESAIVDRINGEELASTFPRSEREGIEALAEFFKTEKGKRKAVRFKIGKLLENIEKLGLGAAGMLLLNGIVGQTVNERKAA